MINIVAVLLFSASAFCQDVLLRYNGSGSYVYVERTDLRRYDNGKYTGLVSREVRSFIYPIGVPEGGRITDSYYDGSFYINEGTVRNSANVGIQLNDSVPTSFRITEDGELIMIKDNGFPSFRSFPAFTKNRIKYGDRWQSKAERIVDPLNKGVRTKMPIYVEYTYLKDDSFHGEDVFVISAQWATRYGTAASLDFGGDRDLKFAAGKHSATMYVSKRTGNTLVVRDTVDEEFQYVDGNRIAFKGTISMFTEYPPAYDKSKILPALQRVAGISKEELSSIINKPLADKSNSGTNDLKNEENTDKKLTNGSSGVSSEKQAVLASKNKGVSSQTGKNEISKINTKQIEKNKVAEKLASGTEKNPEKSVTVEKTSAGIMLTMQNLKFKPDSAELLPGENERLDQIADLLKLVPEQMFLVEGHTASVGNPRGEQQLSMERAQSIVSALKKRGVNGDRFIVKGAGGTRPVADNSTPEGKSKNRRVEITILE